ncbi:acyl-ACP--UDP-N-acetylglucosamine O-acyltransferase [Acidithiobacillus sp. M4-SHS-6]|uniref:acyl-ACP--UDP-N-acetylglucosamine O-acyltransferase n=1 Tax=Acidithiobacillus sp. M4-SHS-6 TaxID=3383024 RepID=UPI0039BE8C88
MLKDKFKDRRADNAFFSADIHKTAIIHPSVHIGTGSVVGPYTYIGPGVKIGINNVIERHVDIAGGTTIGDNNRIYSNAAIGGDPQDRTYQAEHTELIIGDNNIIREFVTISRGTVKGGGVTRIGDHNMFMAYAHIAHDCSIGNYTTLVNSANLAGHVHVEDRAFIGGLVAIHQHVVVGTMAIVGLNTCVSMDVPPFTMAAGNRAALRGINVIGLKRNGFSEKSISRLKKSYPILFREHSHLQDRIEKLEALDLYHDEVRVLTEFIKSSKRGYLRHYKRDINAPC